MADPFDPLNLPPGFRWRRPWAAKVLLPIGVVFALGPQRLYVAYLRLAFAVARYEHNFQGRWVPVEPEWDALGGDE